MDATLIFLGRLTPTELCRNFSINSALKLGADLEAVIIRDGMAVEYVGDPQPFDKLSARITQIAGNLLAAYAYYPNSAGLRWTRTNWIEVRGMVSHDNVIGFVDPFSATSPVSNSHPDNLLFRQAEQLLTLSLTTPSLRLALSDYHRARLDPSDDSAFHAFRAVEVVRQQYDTKPKDWHAMHAAIGTGELMLAPLTKASIDIRHGKALNLNPADRLALIGIARQVIKLFIDRLNKDYGTSVPLD